MAENTPENRACRYLLDDLSARERQRYESELVRKPALRAGLRAAGDDLVAWVDERIEPVQPSGGLWSAIEDRLATQPPQEGHTVALARQAESLGARLARWRVAALVLLSTNLLLTLLWLLSDPAQPATDNAATASGPHFAPAAAETLTAMEAELENLQRSNAEWQEIHDRFTRQLRAETSEIARLRQIAADQTVEAELTRSEEARLRARLNTFFEPREGRAHLALIEMRARGGSSPGYLEHARQLILNPFTTDGESPSSSAPDASETSSGGDQWTGIANPAPEDPAGENGADPAALAVWRSDLQTGYLNIYGLPEAAEGESYHLWATSSEAGEFMPIGALPAGSAGTVLLEFASDQPAFYPESLIITRESGTPGPEPGPDVILVTPGD